MLAACWGLLAGWLEVGTRVLARAIDPTGRLNMMSRHYVWTVPLSNLLLFFVAGLLLALVTRRFSPGRGVAQHPTPLRRRRSCRPSWSRARNLPMGVADPGSGNRDASGRLRSSGGCHECGDGLKWSFPALLGSVAGRGGPGVRGRMVQAAAANPAAPFPPGDSPNVLLIVLDTVRADHLTLYGYPRDTSRTLDRLAKRGIRFDGGAGNRPLDPRLAREHVHRPLAP